MKLKSAFDEAGLPAKINVYKDTRMVGASGKPVYIHDKTEEAGNALLLLFETALT